MRIAGIYTAGGVFFGYEKGGRGAEKFGFRSFRYGERGRDNAPYNKMLAGEVKDAETFLRECLGACFGSAEGKDEFCFVLPDDLSAEEKSAYKEVCLAAGKQFGAVCFLSERYAAGGYAATHGIGPQFAILTAGQELGLDLLELGKEKGGELRLLAHHARAASFSFEELLLTALGRAVFGEDKKVDPSLLSPSEDEILSELCKEPLQADYRIWEDTYEKGRARADSKEKACSFCYEGREYELRIADVDAALEPFRDSLRNLAAGAQDIPTPLLCMAADLPAAFAESAALEAVYHNSLYKSGAIRAEGVRAALEGALAVMGREVSFTYTFPYELGIKIFELSEDGGTVIVKPDYFPVIPQGADSSAYAEDTYFDEVLFQVEDEGASLILYARENGRIREIPLAPLSDFAKKGETVRFGIRVEGRELYLLAAGKGEPARIPLSQAIEASLPGLIKVKEMR